MIVRTEHNRFGVIELEENRIDFCYQPDFSDEYKNLEKISMDDLIEINGALGIGGYVTKELKEQMPDLFQEDEIGDPLNEANVETLLSLAKEIKERFPNKTMWIYSGYTWEQVMYPIITDDFNPVRDMYLQARRELVSICDVFCDGRYVKECRDVNKPWVGSDNQRVIDVQKSLNEGTVCLHGDTKDDFERE